MYFLTKSCFASIATLLMLGLGCDARATAATPSTGKNSSAVAPVSTVATNGTNSPAVTTAIWTFPNGTWIENLQVLSNGSLLASTITHPYIYLFHPSIPGSGDAPSVAYTFPNVTSTLGLAEVAPYVIAVIAGSLNPTTLAPVKGSWSVHLLDFSPLQANGPTLLATFPIPGASFLNGMTTLPSAPGYLLLADSDLGAVWQLNIYTGGLTSYSDPLFGMGPNSTEPAINGIRVAEGTPALQAHAQYLWSEQAESTTVASNQTVNDMGSTYLYFSNSNTDIFGRIAITRYGLPLNGAKAQMLAAAPTNTSYDDFQLAPDGSFALIADWIGTSIQYYDAFTGVQMTSQGGIGDADVIDHPTSVHWANSDYSAVYISTAGSNAVYGGNGGGQVLSIVLS